MLLNKHVYPQLTFLKEFLGEQDETLVGLIILMFTIGAVFMIIYVFKKFKIA